MSGNEPRLVIEAPPVQPRRFGLYSVADVQAAEPHALMGVEIADSDLNCGIALDILAGDPCVEVDLSTIEENTDATVEYDPFLLVAHDDCAGVGGFGRARERAVKKFNLREERGVEWQVGTLMTSLGTDITGVTTVDLPTSLALLEQWLDENYAGQGTILGSRAAVSLLSKNGSVLRHGNRIETVLGSKVAGIYMPTTGPESNNPEAGETILWATGQVIVRYGVMIATDPMFVPINAGTNEVQTVVITGTPTGGNFTLTFNGETTADIAYNANAAAVQAALLLLSNLDTGDVTVTGTNPNFTITFGADYAATNPPQITATAALTGGTAPGVTVGTTTEGETWETDNTYRVGVQKPFVVSLDCAVAGIEATLSA